MQARSQKATQNTRDEENNYAYISQGRAGCISKESTIFGINGLYTDNFTTCVILVCVGFDQCAGRASLLHIDSLSLMSSDQVINELNWVGNSRNIVIFYKNSGSQIAAAIKQIIGKCKDIR